MTADLQLWSAHDARRRLVDGARFRLFALSATAELGKAIAENRFANVLAQRRITKSDRSILLLGMPWLVNGP